MTRLWRQPLDDAEQRPLVNGVKDNIMIHPGYTGRVWQTTPPSIRIGLRDPISGPENRFSGFSPVWCTNVHLGQKNKIARKPVYAGQRAKLKLIHLWS